MSISNSIKKVLAYIIPSIIIIAFLVVLASGGYLKANTESGKQIPKLIDKIETLIQNEAWEEALGEKERLQNHWNTLTPLIQISTTEETIKDFSRALNNLDGYLKGKEQGMSLAEIAMLRFSWDSLEN